ncbi:hypothetical protein C922_05729, partial [Plasmodium inui San Antonio 1]
KVIMVYEKETAENVIYETADNPSGRRCLKEKQEVYDHKLCVLTDEGLHTEELITLFMMLLDGCKEQ